MFIFSSLLVISYPLEPRHSLPFLLFWPLWPLACCQHSDISKTCETKKRSLLHSTSPRRLVCLYGKVQRSFRSSACCPASMATWQPWDALVQCLTWMNQQGRVTGVGVSVSAFGSDLVMATQLTMQYKGAIGFVFTCAYNIYHLGELFYKHFLWS